MTSSTPYRVGCPYCGKLYSHNSKGKHLVKYHPDKPKPSDPEFPGWKQE